MPESTNRRTRDSEAARGAILSAAEEHFARYGYSGARVDAIAEASGYNKSLIFHYFGDKLGLYRAVIGCVKGDQEQHFYDVVLRFVGDDAPPLTRAQVRDYIVQAVGFWFDRLVNTPNLRRILMWEAAEEWQTFASAPAQPAMTQRFCAIARFLQRAQAAGFIRADIDPIFVIANMPLLAMIDRASLARHAMFFPDHDFTSPAAQAHARAQIICMVLYSTMTPTPAEQSDAI